MAKTKVQYVCQNCGATSPKWLGKCPACLEWNTYIEEVEQSAGKQHFAWQHKPETNGKRPRKVQEIPDADQSRIMLPDKELERALGGGLVPGSLVLLGGEPGIGKSTLLLQLALQLDLSVLYVSGEESEQQIRMRAARIGIKNEDCYLYAATHMQNIFQHARNLKPDIMVVDSIQTLHSDYIDSTPGTVSQIRECTGELQRFAKETNTPVFIIGHITKEGTIAGPKLLEHMVDTVLQFEGEQNYNYRLLRTLKNRFGSTAELGIYEMQGSGLREVSNPSELLLSHRAEPLSGMAIATMLDGVRPMLIEVQALVATAVYGTPQRSTTGFDIRRLHMLLAVLEKRGGLNFSMKDVFLNIAGGLKVNDPAIDLAVAAALITSFSDHPVPKGVCFAGEVGLSGEIRAVNRIDERLREADKLGFEKVYLSAGQLKNLEKRAYQIELAPLETIAEMTMQIG